MFLRIEPSSGVPITRQIMDQIRAHCASGVAAPGDKLPSVRHLATRLAVNQNTILKAYERLTAEGLLEMRHGDGTYVAAFPAAAHRRRQLTTLDAEAARLVRHARSMGLDDDTIEETVARAMKRDKMPAAKLPVENAP